MSIEVYYGLIMKITAKENDTNDILQFAMH